MFVRQIVSVCCRQQLQQSIFTGQTSRTYLLKSFPQQKQQQHPNHSKQQHQLQQRTLSIFSKMSSAAIDAHTLDAASAEINKQSVKDGEPILRLNNIEKSQQDTRDYRGLQLENGMKVLLVSDPQTDVSAAALAVQVGHMSDPVKLPGLAHFCEHMLFLGTKKYPHENGYTTYLSQSSGSSNAATYPLMTKYHFNVGPDHLDGALDRFAQFFIGPLFTPSATDREIKAVNSEHEKNLSSDLWRVKQVNRHLAKPDHPLNKFGSGNKETLLDIPKSQNIDVREELLNFHQKWYSANIMCLSVLGKESLDVLEQMAIEKFSEIENKNVELPSWPRDPFDESSFGEKVLIVPIKELRTLTVSFITDDLSMHYRSSPENYLTHLIGHEAKGSLLSQLRKLGWCNDLMAGHNNTLRGYGFFEIVVDLTTDGLEHVDDIIHLIFQYLRMLREVGPQKWFFDECVHINEMRFRFKDKEQPEGLVSHLVSAMQIYPLDEVLTAPYMSNEWNPELITKLLDDLVPSKCRVIVLSQSFADQATETEPYYKTKFGRVKIEPETLKRWESCTLHENLALPLPNAFIANNFDLEPIDADITKHPIIVLDTPVLRVWHKQDDVYKKPKSYMLFDVNNPVAYLDPLNCTLNHLMVTLLKDQLNEYLYDAELAGLKLLVSTKSSGIEFGIRGYSEKQVVLLEKLLNHMFDFKIDEKRFDILKEEYTRSLKNFNAEQPYQHAMYYLALILTESAWTNSELLEAMQLVTYERLTAFAREFFQRVHTECFIYGNYTKKQALQIADIMHKRLELTNSVKLPLLARQMLKKREYKLCSGDSYMFQHENDYHKTSCASVYFQCGAQSDLSNITVQLIAQILSEPCYDVLRTKEQLGYIVFSGVRKVNGANGLRIIVQSTKHPSFVEDRIESFLESYVQALEEMPMDEFERHKDALAVKKLEKPKTAYSQFNRFHSEIALSQYHFEREEAEVAILKQITKEELIGAYKDFIAPRGGERRVMSIHIVSSQFRKGEVSEEDNVITSMERHAIVDDLVKFKSSKELYPIAMPFLDITAKGARSKL